MHYSKNGYIKIIIMRNRLGCISISVVGGIFAVLISLVLLFVVMHISVALQHKIELHITNPLSANFNNQNKFGYNSHRSYLCSNDQYKTQLDVYNRETEEFYSYKFYTKLGDVPFIPSLLQFVASMFNLFFVNIVHLMLFFFIGLPSEVFMCNNTFVGLIYLLVGVIAVSCCIFWCACMITYKFICPDYFCRNVVQSNTTINDINNLNDNDQNSTDNNEQNSDINEKDEKGTSRLLDV